MANSIATAVRYFNNDAELEKIYQAYSYTADFIKPNVAVGAKTVKYRQVSLGSTVLGDYNRETGYTRTNINVSWVEKSLTQDKGNVLRLDKMDGEEAQSLEIATVGRKYIREVQIPSVDKYRFTQLVGATGSKVATGALTADTIEAAIDSGLDYLYDLGVRENLTLHIATSKARLLKQAAKSTGSISTGSWGGDLSVNVTLYGDATKAKVIQVPDDILGEGIDFILTATPAFAAFAKYRDNEYFDKIPGFGSRMTELDLGIYHDAWVEPGAEKAVYIHKPSDSQASSETE